MNSRILLGGVFAIVVLMTALYLTVPNYLGSVQGDGQDEYNEQEQEEQIAQEEQINQEEKEQEESAVEVDAVQVKEESKVVPTNTESVPLKVVYTKAVVATHNSETSCWTIINGGVYDLTSFVSKHPGGDRNILKICGIDGTKLFEGQHDGDSKPEAKLQSFYLAPLRN